MRRPEGRRALPAAGAALALTMALGACSPQSAAPPTPEASGVPVTVVHGGQGLEPAVAAVLTRHLRQHGHAVADEDGVPVEPPAWAAAGGSEVAVVDTLLLAAAADPAVALPAPPAPSPTASESAAPSPGDPAVPSAPATDPAVTDPAAAPTPTPLPDGEPAADAAEAGRVLERLLQAQPGEEPAPTAEDGAVVLASSAGVLRLTAVLTQTTAARLGVASLADLNGRCEGLAAAAPAGLTDAGDPEAAAALRARLDRLAGCRPGTWLEGAQDPTAAVVADQAQVGLTTAVDPEIEASMLMPLEDDERVLPEGRLAAVGEAGALQDDAERRISEVMSALDADGLRQLERLTTGADALPPAEAARYWLVDRGLEDAPEDWFVPDDSWF